MTILKLINQRFERSFKPLKGHCNPIKHPYLKHVLDWRFECSLIFDKKEIPQYIIFLIEHQIANDNIESENAWFLFLFFSLVNGNKKHKLDDNMHTIKINIINIQACLIGRQAWEMLLHEKKR